MKWFARDHREQELEQFILTLNAIFFYLLLIPKQNCENKILSFIEYLLAIYSVLGSVFIYLIFTTLLKRKNPCFTDKEIEAQDIKYQSLDLDLAQSVSKACAPST